MNKKTIAFAISSMAPGGAQRVVSALSKKFIDRFEIIIITFQDKPSFYPIDERIKIISCTNQINPSKNIISAFYLNIRLIVSIIKILRKNNVNLCISFLTTVNTLTIIASKIIGIPIIISERNNPIIVPPNRFWRFLRNASYKYSDYLVVQSNGSRRFFKKITPNHKIKIIQNPISENIRINNTRSEINLNNEEIKILSVGRLTKNKAVHITILALSKLSVTNWRFYIAGDGPLLNELIELCKSLNILHKVMFLGNIKNVEDYFYDADIFVFTSRSEGFPNALMEAYYSGMPCISTNCDFGPSDIIETNEDGFLIPVDDVESLKEKLGILITNKDIRSQFSIRAMNKSKRFEITHIANQWYDLIEDLI